MIELNDHQTELERLAAVRAELRNELANAIQGHDQSRFLQSGADNPPGIRPLAEIESAIVLVELQIADTERAQVRTENDALSLSGRDSTVGLETDMLLEAADPIMEAGGVMLNGALGGRVGEHIVQLVEHVEMKLENRALLLDALAESHLDSKEVERENAVLDEVRRVDLDPQLGKTLAAIDERHAQKKQELDGKLATLQEKFDERHAGKSVEERQVLQATLDKQFDTLRAQLEKTQELERQRALEAQAREQAERANATRDTRDDAFGR